MANPDYAVYTALSDAGIDSTYSCTLHVHPIREKDDTVGHKSVFVVMTGEANPIDFLDGSGNSSRTRLVQVMVRSDPDEYQAGQTLTFAARDVLHLATLSGKVGCRVFSGPWLLEKDNIDRYIWSFNVEVLEVS